MNIGEVTCARCGGAVIGYSFTDEETAEIIKGHSLVIHGYDIQVRKKGTKRWH